MVHPLVAKGTVEGTQGEKAKIDSSKVHKVKAQKRSEILRVQTRLRPPGVANAFRETGEATQYPDGHDTRDHH